MSDLEGKTAIKRSNGAIGSYMFIGEIGTILEHDLELSRVYIKGENFSTWVYLRNVEILCDRENSDDS